MWGKHRSGGRRIVSSAPKELWTSWGLEVQQMVCLQMVRGCDYFEGAGAGESNREQMGQMSCRRKLSSCKI